MKTKTPPKFDVKRELVEIVGRLNQIEELMMWRIRADARFRKGQRVKFSAIAKRRAFMTRRKGGVVKGTVLAIVDIFTVKVLLDGYKHPKEFHHMFFEAVSK